MTKSAIAATLAASLVAPSLAQAAEGDYYNAAGELQGDLKSIILDDAKFKAYVLGLDQYKVELGNKFYNAEEVNNLYNKGATEKDIAQKVIEAGLKGEEATLAVTSVTAINATQIKVTFNKAADSVLPSNFAITQKDDDAKFFVQSAVLADDKKSATVTLYDAMAEGKTYTVATTGIATSTNEVTYVAAVPASIEFKSSLPEAASVDVSKYVVIKDVAGNEVTGYEPTITASVRFTSGTTIDTRTLKSVTLNATLTLKDGTTITTGNQVVAVEALKAATVESFKLVDGTKDVAKLFLNGKILDKDNKVISATGLKVVATFKDQYGKDFPAASTVTYESLTPTVVSVATNGTVTPVSVGTAYVRVVCGKLTKTIELTVSENPKVTTVEVADTLEVVGDATTPAGQIKVTVKDQYGNPVASQPVTAKSSMPTVATATVASSGTTDTKGEVTVNVQGLKEGTTKVTVTVGEINKEVTVTVVKAGTVASYEIITPDDTIDLNAGASDTDATIQVYELDGNGKRVKDITSDVTFELPATGSLIKADTTPNKFVNATSPSTNTKTGTTTVTVKQGTLTIGTATIKVVDTTDKVAKVEVINPLIKLTTSTEITNFNGTTILDAIAKNLKMTTASGKVLDDTSDLATKKAAIVELLTSNVDAVKVTSTTGTIAGAAQTNIEGAPKTTTLTVKLANEVAPVAFNVSVADVTAPTLASSAPTTLESANKKVLTIAFSEEVLNAGADLDALKGALKLATDGSKFNSLDVNDTVAIIDGKLVITFNTALSTSTNKVKIAANALKDAAGNKNLEITTDAVNAS